jgi:hypothetical protein
MVEKFCPSGTTEPDSDFECANPPPTPSQPALTIHFL